MPPSPLRNGVAKALKNANAELGSRGFVLKVYDCYRPQKAVKAFVQWAAKGAGTETSSRYHPHVAKSSLIPLGYIAPKSSHSSGIAVDLTIAASGERQKTPASVGAINLCTDPAEDSGVLPSIDMGTAFDCFDPKSHTSTTGLTPKQVGNRQLLVDVMSRYGFVNYPREWWHFTHRPSAGDATSHDFTVTRQ